MATKFGVIGLTMSAAVVNGRHAIRINAVAPGATRSPLLAGAMDADPDMERRLADNVPLGLRGRTGGGCPDCGMARFRRVLIHSGVTLMVDGGNTPG